MDPDRYAGFMRAILENPEEDASRLVLADALEEEGDPRGEFVRVQVALARDPGVCTPQGGVPQWGEWRERRPHFDALRRRERELLNDHALTWLEELPDPPGRWLCINTHPNPLLPGLAAEFRRGFVEHVKMTAADWLAHGPAVVRAQPVARVTLSDKRPMERGRSHRGGNRGWGWYRADGGGHAPWLLPEPLWTPGRFRTAEAAIEALGRTALAFARSVLPAPAGAPADATELADGPWRRRE
jgi:uncharacterized protein (TIGR02996 family)